MLLESYVIPKNQKSWLPPFGTQCSKSTGFVLRCLQNSASLLSVLCSQLSQIFLFIPSPDFSLFALQISSRTEKLFSFRLARFMTILRSRNFSKKLSKELKFFNLEIFLQNKSKFVFFIEILMALNKQHVDACVNTITFFVASYPPVFIICFGTNLLSEFDQIRLILCAPIFGTTLTFLYEFYYIMCLNWEVVMEEVHDDLEQN
jgi:hypothetical protein